MTIETECRCLQQLEMFANLDVAKLKLVAMISDRVTFRAGEAIYRSGDPSDAVFIVLEGSLKLLADGAPDTDPGLCGRRLSVTMVAETPVTALRMHRDDFMRLIRETPDFSFAVMRELAKQLDRGSQYIARISQLSRQD